MLKILSKNYLSFKVSKILEFPKGNDCLKVIEKHFSYKNPDHVEAKKWGRSIWNIPEFLYSFHILGDELKLYRGCLSRLVEILNKFDVQHEVIDFTLISEPTVIFTKPRFQLREEQKEFLKSYIDFTRDAVVKNRVMLANTSFGKCHAKGTEVIMYNGSVKKVEDIKVGDSLMGVDSKPRTVQSLGRGRDVMYKITGFFKEPFVCNADHILSLQVTSSKSNHFYKKIDKLEISVKDYLTLNKSRKHFLKLWSTGVEFKKQKTKIPPYFLGLWLGDGSKNNCLITNNKETEIVNYLGRLAVKNGLVLETRTQENRTNGYIITNGIKFSKNMISAYLRKNCVKNNIKNIPERYLINSKRNRLDLLAGIIDSDGHLIKSNYKTYEIVAKNKELAEQILFLARSLGLAARSYIKKTNYTKNGKKIETGYAYRIFISGETEIIPVKLERKKASSRKMRTNPLRSGFKVENIGLGDYYGFTLDQDSLYLLKDFTVTHNTISSIYVANELQQVTTVLVHTTFAQKQWINTLINDFNISKSDIGGAGGQFSGKPKVGKINVALYHSMSKKEINIFFKEKTGFLIVDECLHENTLIRTPSGLSRLKDLNIGDLVLSPSGIPVKIKNKWYSEKESIKVTTRGGGQIIGSKDHLMQTFTSSWKIFSKLNAKKEIKKLVECKNLALFKGSTENTIASDFDEFIGWFIGDGTTDRGHIKFSFRKYEKVTVLKNLLDKLGFHYKESTNSRGDVTIGLKNRKLFSKKFFTLKAKDKVIPKKLFNELSIGVLRGLFDSDGTFTNNYAEFDSTSELLAKQVFNMLRMLGIKASIYTILRKNNKHRTIYRVQICGDSILIFNKIIGFKVASKDLKLKKYSKKIKTIYEHENVKSIENVGVQKLIDIELDNDEKLFVANGFISHNCQLSSINQFTDAITAFRPRYTLAMTAGSKDITGVTQLYRKDGKQFAIFDLCGDVGFRSKDEESNSKIFAKIFSTVTNYKPESDHPSIALTEMSRIKDRNILIAKRAVVAHKNNKLVIIFVQRKEQAAVLAKYLSKFRVGLLFGSMAPKEIAELKISDEAKEILLNNDPKKSLDEVTEKCLKKELDFVIATQKGEVGLSIETLGHGIVTTPVGNNLERLNQLKGRLERKHKDERLELFGEKHTPYLEIIADNYSSSINSWSSIKEQYKEHIIKNPYIGEK